MGKSASVRRVISPVLSYLQVVQLVNRLFVEKYGIDTKYLIIITYTDPTIEDSYLKPITLDGEACVMDILGIQYIPMKLTMLNKKILPEEKSTAPLEINI